MDNVNKEEESQKEQELMQKLIDTQKKYQQTSQEKKGEGGSQHVDNSDDILDDGSTNYKKYVIRVNKQYAEYLDALPKKKRNILFNKYLETEINTAGKRKRAQIISKTLKHIIVIILTVVVAFPILFYLVNFSMKSTVENYKYMQNNFEKLYQQRQINEY